ncbi:MAG: TetR/AcrR family transcriptional regulator [Christensenellales bacterium]|jgi:AcrR family transcriptional regulator
MPPKPKFTKEKIVQTALEIVSKKGVEALTAKELGDALGSSARPIFTVFNSMKEVQNEVRAAAMCRFENFAEKKLPDMPLFKQVGMQMVLFGAKEPKLYQLLFMQENRNAVSFDDVFGELGPTAETCIGLIRDEYGMSETDAKRLFENVWIYTFGVGALCATRVCHFSEEKLGEMLSTEFQAMMLLVKSKAGEEK